MNPPQINNSNSDSNLTTTIKNDPGQQGSAIVIALFILALLSVFVALALTRAATEASAVGNETAEGRTMYAAQGSLEVMTRNFNKVFERKVNPTEAEVLAVTTNTPPGFANYNFLQELDPLSESSKVTLNTGDFAGLYAVQDNWRMRTTATDPRGVQVQLTRNILNNRIPIFQFGIFYEDDLELYRPPRFAFGGRVHSNRHFFLSPGDEGVYFNSRVTTVGELVTQSWRNGNTEDKAKENTFIKNASSADVRLYPYKASVLNTDAAAADNIFIGTDLPPSKRNTNWKDIDSKIFDGNLKTQVKPLKLPLNIGDDSSDLIETIRRGKTASVDLHNKNGTVEAVSADNADKEVLISERFANKTGIRISLADSKAKLPGCASGIGVGATASDCGIRLDGDADGKGLNPLPLPSPLPSPFTNRDKYVRGYQPKKMKDNYQATRVNGERLFNSGQEVWIKVETVETNETTGAIIAKDITEDFLSLGLTERPREDIAEIIDNYGDDDNNDSTDDKDSDNRSIIKIQRFAIPSRETSSIITGLINKIPGEPTPNGTAFTTAGLILLDATKYLYRYSDFHFAVRFAGSASSINNGCVSGCNELNLDPNNSPEKLAHLKSISPISSIKYAIVPFPIKMFDSREGTYYDSSNYYSDFGDDPYYDSATGAGLKNRKVTGNGVMSMIDIDVKNLRRFLTDKEFDSDFQNGLTSAKIPDKNGWVLYVSDRRGDKDFDGEYDMEDIYSAAPGNDGGFQPGSEDVNKNGLLDAAAGYTSGEAVKYSEIQFPDLAAVTDHKYYRRGVRLINGETLPGKYDKNNAANTKGFTLASENGVYILGNYNSTGVKKPLPSTGNSPYNEYYPFDTDTHIPASVVADSVTILSTAWQDAGSFAVPFNAIAFRKIMPDIGGKYFLYGRIAKETTIRTAIIAGDTLTSGDGTPNQGGLSPRLNGGVHNFKRFLETWVYASPNTGLIDSYRSNLNYAGSLINLYNSHNNNGSFKCCTTIYNPPVRNWVFDETFLDPNRLPPGPPFFQYVKTTGFQRTNN